MRYAWSNLTIVGTMALFLGSGCGGSSAGASPRGTGGAGGAGGTTGGASSGGDTSAGTTGGSGGEAAQPAVPRSKRAACRAYVTAQCQRRAECSNDPREDCTTTAVHDCPDLMFSEGSLRTIEGMFACAEEWKTFDCEATRVGKLPACVIAGAAEDGAPCIHGSQCASNWCSGYVNRCGQCLPVVASEGMCDPDVSINVCPNGEHCPYGTCTPRSPVMPLVPRPEGTACESDVVCADGLVCASESESSPRVCLPSLEVGASCYFRALDGRARSCGREPTDPICAQSGFCEAASGRGQPCTPNSHGSYSCAVGLYCSSATEKCEPTPKLGEACGTVFGATSFVCAESVCRDGTCSAPREEGESCTEANVHCVQDTECVDGRCRATDALVQFAKACSP